MGWEGEGYRSEVIADCKLEPGGYLQWVERDWMSKFPEKAEKGDDAHTQITCYHRSKLLPKTRSVAGLSFSLFCIDISPLGKQLFK